jgi:excisionase family DNA binding protein
MDTEQGDLDLLTVEGLMEFLRVSRSTVYRLVDCREIPHYKIGHGLRFDRREIVAYVRRQRIRPMSENGPDPVKRNVRR